MKTTETLRRFASRRKFGQISVSKTSTNAGRTASKARRTEKTQSNGKYRNASAKGMRSLASAKAVNVVVDPTIGLSGYVSLRRFTKATPESASPTETAWTQIVPLRFAGKFAKPAKENPRRWPKLLRY